jgi:O-antigen/teichoic acid export membrane protein
VDLETEVAEPAAPPLHPAHAIVTLGAVQALTMAAGLARTKVMALLLGPAGVGVASVVDQALSLIAQLGSVSVPFATLKFLSRARSAHADEQRQIYGALFKTLVIASTAAAVIGIGLAGWKPDVFGDGLASFRLVVVLALAGVPPFALAPMLRNVLAAFDRNRAAALAALFTAILSVAGAYLGVRLGGLAGLYVANGLVSLLTVIALQRYIAGTLGMPLSARVQGMPTFDVLKAQPGLFRFAGAMYVLSLTSPVAYLFARSSLLSEHGAVEAGLVAAAYGVAVSLRLVLHQANALYLLPLVNRGSPKGERMEIVAEYMRVLVMLVACAALAIALFPHEVLIILYSARFLGAVHYVTLFVIAETVLLLGGVYQTLLVGFDDIGAHLASTASGHVLTIVLARFLVPGMGGAGVGVAFLAGNSVILLGTALRVWRAHSGAKAVAPLVALAGGFVAIAAAGWWAAHGDRAPLLWRAGALVAGLGIAIAVLRPAERRWLFSLGRTDLPRQPAA